MNNYTESELLKLQQIRKLLVYIKKKKKKSLLLQKLSLTICHCFKIQYKLFTLYEYFFIGEKLLFAVLAHPYNLTNIKPKNVGCFHPTVYQSTMINHIIVYIITFIYTCIFK